MYDTYSYSQSRLTLSWSFTVARQVILTLNIQDACERGNMNDQILPQSTNSSSIETTPIETVTIFAWLLEPMQQASRKKKQASKPYI